ncbi:membrane protein [Mycobacterium phage Konstantine]|uniref:Uncharacterized protein n=1 Tax=Mycobacterium phage Konstantine TaxID=563121 RepID=B5U4Y3_9CAUD|nr:membrane protein [Mycobacterium phage Konstantine]ACI12429.1 hypothetical protein KONSTANTINE_13 [Mycobacterium phage Konstantine]
MAYKFTARRRTALKKAALASARKRRKSKASRSRRTGTVTLGTRKHAVYDSRRNKRRRVATRAAGAAIGTAVGGPGIGTAIGLIAAEGRINKKGYNRKLKPVKKRVRAKAR